MPRPLQYGDPRILGAFRLDGRLHEADSGIVYLGQDSMGRQVSIAVLTRGAAADPAARDRFQAAVAGSRDGGEEGAPVVAADVNGPTPWAATAWDGRQAGAERFLRAVDIVGPGLAGQQDVRGPQFQPHWAGANEPAVPPYSDPAYPGYPAPPTSGGSRTGLWLALGGGGLALCLLLVLGVFLSTRPSDEPDAAGAAASSSPGAAPSPGASTQPTGDPTGGPAADPTSGGSTAPEATPEPGSNAGAGPVVGATYRKGDDTYTMSLADLGFSFRTPASWGCVRSDKAAVRWVCLDERYKGKGRPPGGIVQTVPCPSPCGSGERRKLVNAIDGVKGSWKTADPHTRYATWTFSEKGVRRYAIVMVHFWHKGGADELNSLVLVSMDGVPDTKSDLQKIVNDIHANTP